MKILVDLKKVELLPRVHLILFDPKQKFIAKLRSDGVPVALHEIMKLKHKQAYFWYRTRFMTNKKQKYFSLQEHQLAKSLVSTRGQKGKKTNLQQNFKKSKLQLFPYSYFQCLSNCY